MTDPLDEAVAHIMDSDPAIRQADTWGRITAAFIRPLLRTVGVTRPMAEGFTHALPAVAVLARRERRRGRRLRRLRVTCSVLAERYAWVGARDDDRERFRWACACGRHGSHLATGDVEADAHIAHGGAVSDMPRPGQGPVVRVRGVLRVRVSVATTPVKGPWPNQRSKP